MRRKINRTSEILSLLAQEGRVEVARLADELNVSQVTMRKDLDELEGKGLIRREHGYAVLKNRDDLGCRMAYHYDVKKKIAEEASRLIQNGETVMIENGSCCALLADTLTQTHKDLTIITNSAALASYIHGKSSFQIVLLGGIFQQDSQVNVGPMVKQGAEGYYVDKFFIGTEGYSKRTGFTNQDGMRAQAVQDMAGQASRVIVLSESEKFKHHGIVPLHLDHLPVTLITDDKLDETIQNELESDGVKILMAKS